MDALSKPGSHKTPKVNFDHTTGLLELAGRSIPENSVELYKPMMEWMDEYTPNALDKTAFNVKLEYFNTSSSKCILDLLKKLENIRKLGKEVCVNWHYEVDDYDMLEAGENYQSILKLPFNMVEIDEE